MERKAKTEVESNTTIADAVTSDEEMGEKMAAPGFFSGMDQRTEWLIETYPTNTAAGQGVTLLGKEGWGPYEWHFPQYGGVVVVLSRYMRGDE